MKILINGAAKMLNLVIDFFKNGAYIVAQPNIYGFHLEPVEGVNETDRDQFDMQKLLFNKVPLSWPRKSKWSPWPDIKLIVTDSLKIPLCSLQMPVYNDQRYISEAIRSLQKQSFSDWELVICDDGSADDTLHIIKKFIIDDPRIKVFHQSKKGRKAALITAQKYSRGHYWCIFNSDDVMHENYLELTSNAMENMQKDGVGVIYTNHYCVSEDDYFIDSALNTPCISREQLFLGNISAKSCMIDSRYWNRSIKYSDNIRHFADYEMILVLSNYCKSYHLQEPLYGLRSDHLLNNFNCSIQKNFELDFLRYQILELNGISGWEIVRTDEMDPDNFSYLYRGTNAFNHWQLGF